MISLQLQKQLSAANGKMHLDLELELNTGQLYALYGKSGAGKTSILRMLAGLLSPDQGWISFDDEVWFSSKNRINVKPQKRQVGLVFQDYALFPNMTVEQNLRFALDQSQETQIVDELIEIMELAGLRQHRPAKLSGGQQQRVALARALVQRPKLLLLDEPLSALDTEMRQKLQSYIRQVHERYQITTILVSHNRTEVQKMADYVLQIDAGKIIAQGPPHTVFEQPLIQLQGIIHKIEPMGDQVEISIKIPDQPMIKLILPNSKKWIVGSPITINGDPPQKINLLKL